MARFRPRLTYSNVVSTICLFVVLGGGAYAASSFVGKDGAVAVCVGKKGVLKILKPGKNCAKGTKKFSWNQKGRIGPSNAFTKSVAKPPCVPPSGAVCTQTVELTGLPKGSYAIAAKAQASGPQSDTYADTEDCTLTAGTHTDNAKATLFRDDTTGSATTEMPMALQVAHTFAAPGKATLVCVSNVVAGVSNVKISAIKLGSVAIAP